MSQSTERNESEESPLVHVAELCLERKFFKSLQSKYKKTTFKIFRIFSWEIYILSRMQEKKRKTFCGKTY